MRCAALSPQDIKISYSYEKFDIVDVNNEEVFIAPIAGFVEVAIPYGNMLGEFAPPTSQDSVMLTRFLANWPNIVIFKPAADLDKDNNVTPRDSLILRRHLAEWEGYKTLPIPINP